MSISLAKARSLCTQAELRIVKASARASIGKLSPGQLKLKTQQAMRLRDKWVDLSRFQRRKTHAKQRSRLPVGNARSKEKAKLFNEVLDRFRAQAEAVERQQQQKAARAKAAKATAVATRTRKAAAPRPGAARKRRRPIDLPTLAPARGPKSLKTDRRTQLSALTLEKQSQFKAGGLVRKLKHVAARNRRDQARRDQARRRARR